MCIPNVYVQERELKTGRESEPLHQCSVSKATGGMRHTVCICADLLSGRQICGPQAVWSGSGNRQAVSRPRDTRVLGSSQGLPPGTVTILMLSLMPPASLQLKQTQPKLKVEKVYQKERPVIRESSEGYSKGVD